MSNGTKLELIRLDNEYLYFHNTIYENEIEKIINGLSNIKESCRYTFEPVDEGEFRLESDYKDNVVYIKCTFYVVDMMESEGIEDNIFEIETTYFMLYEFLIQLSLQITWLNKNSREEVLQQMVGILF